MSNATLSPSPFNFRDRASSFLSNSFLAGSPSESLPPSFLDRRRTSHPHNQPLYEMPDRSQSQQQRPSLMHQASQTIIDLTEEPETPPNVQQNPRQRSRPPQLGRSDALGFGDLIDLTDDNEPDLIITGGRELPPLPRNAARQTAPQRRDDSPSLFMPLPPPPNVRRVFAAHHNGVGIVIGGRMEGSGAPLHMHGNFHIGRMANDIMDRFHFFQHEHPPQAMPGRMDYQNNAFAQRKAEHVPPPPARQDFTRSPKEDDIIICPSCEQELVHRKDGEEPVTKKGGKAPTRKEREEHPFWVLKQCGHVSSLSDVWSFSC
jgi:hypothetical protein